MEKKVECGRKVVGAFVSATSPECSRARHQSMENSRFLTALEKMLLSVAMKSHGHRTKNLVMPVKILDYFSCGDYSASDCAAFEKEVMLRPQRKGDNSELEAYSFWVHRKCISGRFMAFRKFNVQIYSKK